MSHVKSTRRTWHQGFKQDVPWLSRDKIFSCPSVPLSWDKGRSPSVLGQNHYLIGKKSKNCQKKFQSFKKKNLFSSSAPGQDSPSKPCPSPSRGKMSKSHPGLCKILSLSCCSFVPWTRKYCPIGNATQHHNDLIKV